MEIVAARTCSPNPCFAIRFLQMPTAPSSMSMAKIERFFCLIRLMTAGFAK